MRLVVLVCCSAAIAAAAAFVYAPQRWDAALIVAVAMLVCAQVVSLLAARAPEEVNDAKLASLAQRISKNSADLDRLSTRWRDQSQKLAELEQRLFARRTREPASALSHAMPPASLVQQFHSPGLAPVQKPIDFQPVAVPARAPEPAVCLEPVVRLSEGRTAYYKASLRASVAYGHQAAADQLLLRDLLPVLARLRSRRSATAIFVPVSVATLGRLEDLEAYVSILQANPDVAADIVLDLNVSDLATLDETALRGLAWFARLGAAFCLTGRGAARCDLVALSQLGFAFIDVPIDELADATGRLSPGAERLMQAVAARNMTLIAAGVADEGLVARLPGTVSLARGPAFAPPRAVRAQAEQVYPNRQVA
jgi:hypothetical protein